ncbi:alpha/beta-hydrolase [Rickenella mellea]|uniref:Carboxylic ester hydrolase n=1 Tax=Rickenella mellea TaxID=50990 RepID=A0A4Y7PWX5_9AGAM|nr:alpha/beta-hydrolase [Rickenella mellea]
MALVAPQLHNRDLQTTFTGVQHHLSTPEAEIHQYRGIKFASIPARFRRSTLFTSYATKTDATKHGPITPQVKNRNLEERLYGVSRDQIPPALRVSTPRQDEFECLNLTITRPGHIPNDKLLPVMVWVHGGGNVSGSNSDWVCDAGAFVKKSMQLGKPVVVVAINYRLGLLGFGFNNLIAADNAAAGYEGVGNFGLYDQRTALTWVQKHISQFGGSPSNVTLFGSSAGAIDIHCHLLSSYNASPSTPPLFHRAILQSGAIAPCPTSIFEPHIAGTALARIMCALHISTMDELRAVEAERLVALTGERVKPVDDGVFLRKDWRTLSLAAPASKRGFRQDIIIGDVGCEAVLWSPAAQLWTTDAVVRRVRAICQSVYKADALLRAYDIGSNVGDEDLPERVMDLMSDALFACVVEGAAGAALTPPPSPVISAESPPTPSPLSLSQSSKSKSRSNSQSQLTKAALLPKPKVYRYVFDQASPHTDIPHHDVDLVYLFGNVPFPSLPELTDEENAEVNWDRVKVRDAMQSRWLAFANGEQPWEPLRSVDPETAFFSTDIMDSTCPQHTPPPTPADSDSESSDSESEAAASAAVARIKETQVSKLPENKIYVFGPEGETGERSMTIFEGRRRVHAWRDTFAPLGLHVIQKVGLELGNGPPVDSKARF